MLCSSLSFIQRMAARAEEEQGLPALAAHLNAAAATWGPAGRPLKLFRTLEEAGGALTDPRVRYADLEAARGLRVLSVANCHDGQRKLTVALLEFIAAQRCAPEDLMVVYAGASGMAAAVAASVFPGVRFVLFDPAPSILRLMPRFPGTKAVRREPPGDGGGIPTKDVVVYTGKGGWFDDATARWCRETLMPASGRRRLLFVSDIRAGTSEPEIVRDMGDQMRWAVLARADGYMLKFRLPFDTESPELRAAYEEAARAAVAVGARAPPPATGLPYLSGHLYVQLFGRQRTTELRLIGRPGRNGVLTMRRYDIPAIEDAMAVFNAVYRSHAVFEHAGVTGPYEEVAERAVLARCARVVGGAGRAAMVSERLDELLAQVITKDAINCPLLSAAAHEEDLDEEAREYVAECGRRVQMIAGRQQSAK